MLCIMSGGMGGGGRSNTKSGRLDKSFALFLVFHRVEVPSPMTYMVYVYVYPGSGGGSGSSGVVFLYCPLAFPRQGYTKGRHSVKVVLEEVILRQSAWIKGKMHCSQIKSVFLVVSLHLSSPWLE